MSQTPLASGSIFRAIDSDEGLLSQVVADYITDLIMSGELDEGDRLPSERELAEEMGVSRTVVREAIKLLRAAGLLRVRVGIGSFVTLPSRNILEEPLSRFSTPEKRKIAELIELREAIEPPITALAAKNATSEDISKLELAIEEMQANLNNPHEYIIADNVFHNTLAEATQNSLFQLIVHSIVDLLQESRRLAVSSPGAAKRSSYHHRQILEAVKARDVEGAQVAMIAHMSQIKGDIEIGLDRWANKNPPAP
ncbi:MAG TPA: FadR/GntR family transcriptional regulator [candidate division Zixibacteria bacterium]|nr:FadR/GntR family transcriptional regulator [candidate division Zixibacteria bacterium]